MKRSMLFIFFFIVLSLPVRGAGVNRGLSGQCLRFCPLQDDNISFHEVSGLYQDSSGYIWIVTYSSVVRYDGYRMKAYPVGRESGGADGCLHRIVEESDGNMILGTERGLMRLDRTDGKIRRIDDRVTEQVNVTDLVRDSCGRIWIGGDNGVYRKDAGRDVFVKMDFRTGDGKYVTDVIDLLIDRFGSMWITTWASGIFRYDMDGGRLYSYSGGELRHAYVLAVDGDDNLWIGTWGRGVLRSKISPDYGGELGYVRMKHDALRSDSLLDDTIYTISPDASGNIWIGNRSGLSILRRGADGTFRDSFINRAPSPEYGNLPCNEVNSVLMAHDGSIWTGMFGGVVCRVEESEDQTAPGFMDGILDEVRRLYSTGSVHSMIRESDDVFWLGIAGHGMIRCSLDGASFRNYREIREFAGFQYTSDVDVMIRCRGGKEICFGSYDRGVWIYEPETGDTRLVNTATCGELTNDCITALAEDAGGNVWIGTRSGVFRMDAEGVVCSLTALSGDGDASLECKISSISAGPAGDVWVATGYDGIIHVSPDLSVERFPCRRCGGTGSFNSICADSSGRVWAGSTWNGLYRYDAGKDAFVKADAFAFLDGQGVTNIAEDPYGHIWVAANSAVVSFSPEDGGDCGAVSYHSILQNDAVDFFNHNSAVYLPEEDCMAFGCFGGIRTFRCGGPEGDAPEGNAGITEVRIDGKPAPAAGEVVMDRFSDALDIYFSMFDYRNSSDDIYRYRFRRAGTDSGAWRIVTGNSASFRNLSPGKYVFEVCGSGNGSGSGTGCASLNVTVKGNPWLSWWAFLLYVLALAAVFAGVVLTVRSRYKFRRRIEIELENKLVFELKDVDCASVDRKFMQRAATVINEHIADSEFDLPMFAAEMAMSRTVLTEKFKELAGTSPMLSVTNARLQLAYRMITEQKESFRVSDIAYSVGFSDAKYFSKRFKAKYGMSPKELIDKCSGVGGGRKA